MPYSGKNLLIKKTHIPPFKNDKQVVQGYGSMNDSIEGSFDNGLDSQKRVKEQSDVSSFARNKNSYVTNFGKDKKVVNTDKKGISKQKVFKEDLILFSQNN